MTEGHFINLVQAAITRSGALPVVVGEPEILRIIEEAKSWFYQNYEFSVENQHYVIEKGAFNTDQFKNNRVLIMPDCVESVIRFQEINGIGRLGNIDRDFAEDKLIASEIFLSSFHGDDLVMRTAQYQYYDLAKAFFVEQISYNYNRNTNRLKVLGRNPKFNVYVETYIRIPIDKLYEDPLFRKYVVGQARISFGQILSTYSFPLPGGVEVNADAIKSEGEKDIEDVLTQIDEENVPDWFGIYH